MDSKSNLRKAAHFSSTRPISSASMAGTGVKNGGRSRWRGCRPGGSTPSATGPTRSYTTPGECLTRRLWMSRGISRKSPAEPITGSGCRTHSTPHSRKPRTKARGRPPHSGVVHDQRDEALGSRIRAPDRRGIRARRVALSHARAAASHSLHLDRNYCGLCGESAAARSIAASVSRAVRSQLNPRARATAAVPSRRRSSSDASNRESPARIDSTDSGSA